MGELAARSLLGPLALALLELDVITWQHRLAWCHDGLPLSFLLFALPLAALVCSVLASPCLRYAGLFRVLQGTLLLMAVLAIRWRAARRNGV